MNLIEPLIPDNRSLITLAGDIKEEYNYKPVPINKIWAMPNSNTFNIPAISDIIRKYIYLYNPKIIVDPFANNNIFANITNDINLNMPTGYHMDALEFLQMIPDKSVDMVLYDPPYSPRQVSECYKAFDRSVNMTTTQASYWSNQKKEISRILNPNGICITFGWNSGGIGEKYGFKQLEILLVAHGGWHNDTIVTVEIKQR